jgi:hypothetical protein
MGILLRAVNPGAAPERRQMLGRILRLGQRRTEVQVHTVYMMGTVLEKLYQSQKSADSYNKSFEALSKTFSEAEVNELLKTVQ